MSRFGGSGLDAVDHAAAPLTASQADLMLAGGVEMMSLVPIGGTGDPRAVTPSSATAHVTPSTSPPTC